MTILNLTQHRATPDQIEAGVIDLKEVDRAIFSDIITFKKLPNRLQIAAAVSMAVSLCARYYAEKAMIGGAPFLIEPMVTGLKKSSIQPVFAFSKRVSKEVVKDDGTVEKVSVFKHEGFMSA